MLDYDRCVARRCLGFFFLRVAREKSGRVPWSHHKESRDSFTVMLSRGRAMIPAEVKDRLRAYVLTNRYRGFDGCTFIADVEFLFRHTSEIKLDNN